MRSNEQKIASNHPKQLRLWIGLIILAAWILPTHAYASAAHGEAKLADLTWFAINFSLFVVLMYFLLRRSVAHFWNNRADSIQSKVERGRADLRQAKEREERARALLARSSADKAKLLEKIRLEARNESAAIIEDAKRRAELIQEQAKRTIVSEKRLAERSIRQSVAQAALLRAEQLLRSRVNPDLDRRIRACVVPEVSSLVQ